MCILKGFYVHFRDGAKLQKYFINNNIFSKILLAASSLILIFGTCIRSLREKTRQQTIAYDSGKQRSGHNAYF